MSLKAFNLLHLYLCLFPFFCPFHVRNMMELEWTVRKKTEITSSQNASKCNERKKVRMINNEKIINTRWEVGGYIEMVSDWLYRYKGSIIHR